MLRLLPRKGDRVILRSFNASALVEIMEISPDKPHEYKVYIIADPQLELMGSEKWTMIRPIPNRADSSWRIVTLEEAEDYIRELYD